MTLRKAELSWRDHSFLLHESVVGESEIDTLGHVNVRHYARRAVQANAALMKRIGIRPDSKSTVRRADTHVRYHREQFLGAPLNTHGGLVANAALDVDEGLTAYLEVRNIERDEVAASYIMTSTRIENESRRRIGIECDEETMSAFTIDLPEHGRPRSIARTPLRRVSFDELIDLVPDNRDSEFNGRWESIVTPEDCDPRGWLEEELDLSVIAYRQTDDAEGIPKEPTVRTDRQGRRYGWAMIEARMTETQIPTVGETITCLCADIAIAEKSRQTRRWFFSRDSGTLLGVSDHIGLCLDLEVRRIQPIPDDVRQQLTSAALPQFV